jgi:hypothetical protein
MLVARILFSLVGTMGTRGSGHRYSRSYEQGGGARYGGRSRGSLQVVNAASGPAVTGRDGGRSAKRRRVSSLICHGDQIESTDENSDSSVLPCPTQAERPRMTRSPWHQAPLAEARIRPSSGLMWVSLSTCAPCGSIEICVTGRSTGSQTPPAMFSGSDPRPVFKPGHLDPHRAVEHTPARSFPTAQGRAHTTAVSHTRAMQSIARGQGDALQRCANLS